MRRSSTRSKKSRRGRKHRPRNATDDRQLWKVSVLRTFVEKHGIEQLNPTIVVPPGVRIGKWVNECRLRQRRDMMPYWLARELEQIPGWSWDPIGDRQRKKAELMRTWAKQTGLDAEALLMLGEWIVACRQRHRDRLAPDLIQELEAIRGWSWG